jgi:hypothetical protein
VAGAGEKAVGKTRPKPKAQANFTDPASRIMKNSDGAYIQAYNAQAVVDEEHQVITAADVTTNASDALNYTPMFDQSAHNTGTRPEQALVDAGYCSEANLEAARDRRRGRLPRPRRLLRAVDGCRQSGSPVVGRRQGSRPSLATFTSTRSIPVTRGTAGPCGRYGHPCGTVQHQPAARLIPVADIVATDRRVRPSAGESATDVV